MQEVKKITDWAKDPRVPYKRDSLWKAVRAGKLRARRVGNTGMWYVSEEDMAAFLSGADNRCYQRSEQEILPDEE